jgi:hypothetical protein
MQGSKATFIKAATGHEKFSITAIFSVLADRSKLTPSVILGGEGKKKNLLQENLYSGIMFICNEKG